MLNLITELSKFLVILLILLYTFFAYSLLLHKDKRAKKRCVRVMGGAMYAIHLTCFLVLWLKFGGVEYVIFYLSQVLIFLLAGLAYRKLYPNLSEAVFQNMRFLLMIGIVMITRLSFEMGVRQFVFMTASLLVCLAVPFVIERFRYLRSLGWLYGLAGILMLTVVYFFGLDNLGAINSLRVGPIYVQPSEFVKLLYVFMAGTLLVKKRDIRHILLVSLLAAGHVVLLVLERDLGGAAIFAVTYLIMLYGSTVNPLWLFGGLLAGCAAFGAAYQIFPHVRVRVTAWTDPWTYIDSSGYQITQSLFAIGTGGWFGMGLGSGLPESVPVIETDFIFSGIVEEFGLIFAACLVFICLNCFILFVTISDHLKDGCYKIVTLGYASVYGFQLFLNIGGVTKFIPLTGVTLPLVSYGGSSLVSTIVMFSIIQGMYVMGQKKGEAAAEFAPRAGEKKRRKQPKKGTRPGIQRPLPDYSRSIRAVMYVFCVLMTASVAYSAWFVAFRSRDAINNTYNRRQDLLAETIIRGSILSADGEVLARTVANADGEEVREYPYDETFVHVVGRFLQSRTGIELSENFTMLTSSISELDKVLLQLEGEKLPGDSVVTTLNADLQTAAYEALGDRRGAVVAIEPSTGKILAMVSKPDYDPNTVAENWEALITDEEEESALLNRALNGLYPPGSTFKLATTLAYIREHPGDYEEYSYTCEGQGRFHQVTIHCAGNTAHGLVDLRSSFARSCNTSFVNIGTGISVRTLMDVCTGLLYHTTLPGALSVTSSSFVLTEESDENEIPQTVIGLGKTQITPMHNAMIAAAVANGGVLMEPYLIDSVVSADGDVVEKNRPESYGALMTPSEAGILTEYMKAAVEEGTASALADYPVEVAGKTGSAEYETGKESHAWFICFAPADNPEIAISVIVESSGSGSRYALPAAREVLDAYFSED